MWYPITPNARKTAKSVPDNTRLRSVEKTTIRNTT